MYAQSVAAAHAEHFGLDERTILKMTAGFGGGIDGLRYYYRKRPTLASWPLQQRLSRVLWA